MKKKVNVKQIIALLAIVLLVAMYVVTLLAAMFGSTAAGSLFQICLVCTVVVPLFAWIFIAMYGYMTGKKTVADLNLMQDPQSENEDNTSK